MNNTSPNQRPVIGLYQPYPHTFGGVQSVVLNLARALPVYGFRPLVICPERGRFTQLLSTHQVPFLVCDPGPAWHVYGRGARGLTYLLSPTRADALFRYWRRLAQELRLRNVALLHCNDYRGVMLAAPAARLSAIPTLWHMHAFLPSKAANAIAAQLVNWTVPVSQGMLNDLKIKPWLFGKYHVIHNGVLPQPIPAVEDPSPKQVVLAVGTLHPRKGYETLIEAFASVVTRCPQAECWFVGADFEDGSYTRTLQEQTQQLGLTERIKFLGASSEVPKLLAQCRLVCVPSRVEPFGLVAVEAMFAAKPVVATRTGGLPEIVADGSTGWLVEPGDAPAMARAILTALEDPATAEKFGQAGQERAQQLFTLERMMDNFVRFYRRALGQPETDAAVIPLEPAAEPIAAEEEERRAS